MTHGGPIAATAADAALSYLIMAAMPQPGEATHTTSHAYGSDGAPPAHLDGWEEGSGR